MKQKIKMLAARIDRIRLRERGLIFAAAALVLVASLHALLLDPLWARQKQLTEQVVQRQEQIKAVHAQIEALLQAKSEDPNAVSRVKLVQIKQQLAEVETFLQSKQNRLIAPGQMADLLHQILQHNRRLQLLALQTLPAAPLLEQAKSEPAGKAAEKLVYKHGVEITVRGSYLDLMNYLAELEKLPWQMFWGKANLSVEAYPAATLTLTLYTLSLDPAWLTV